MARPSKLNDEVREKLVEAIEAGSTLKDAAAYAGISKSSLDRYREQDEELADALERAEGSAAVGFVRVIQEAAAAGDWRAAAFWLERRRGDEWGKKEQVALTDNNPPAPAAKIDLSRLSNAQLAALKEIVMAGTVPAVQEIEGERLPEIDPKRLTNGSLLGLREAVVPEPEGS